MYLHGTSRVNEQGHLEIGECDTVDLAAEFGTPLYVFDESLIRNTSREFRASLDVSGLKYQVTYASKAFCTVAMCALAAEEQLGLDVVSGGELYTAHRANFPMDRVHFHGNNKTTEEIAQALDLNIGSFVVDNFYELELLGRMATERGKTVHILLRITPGVEAHTHEYISTGQQDSKFGFDLAAGQAHQAVEAALQTSGVQLIGIHSHIGSQIFETQGFQIAIGRLAELYEWCVKSANAKLSVLNVGGGFGIRYSEEHNPPAIGVVIEAITSTIKAEFGARSISEPEVWIEPGRSIVGPAGTTLYTVGSTKEVEGIRKYVAVDGGMTDNPRPALYQAKYEAMLANRCLEPADDLVSIAGKCCESGDMLIWDVHLPRPVAGDILAVSCTGAYNYAMASNYNRIARPAVVFVADGKAEIAVKRESLDDLVSNDLLPERMRVAERV